MTIVIR